MATFTKKLLSGSTNGKQIVVAATSSPGTTIHTTAAGTGYVDEIYLYVYNSDTANRILTLQWGGTTSPDNDIKVTIPFQSGRLLVVDGMLLQNGLAIKAYADAANKLVVDGFVNNIA